MANKEKEGVAVVHLEYPHVKTGKPIAVEPGEEVVDMSPGSFMNEWAAGNIREKGVKPDGD